MPARRQERWFGREGAERRCANRHGVDLIPHSCALRLRKSASPARPRQASADELARRLRDQNPGLEVAAHSGSPDPADDGETLRAIEAARRRCSWSPMARRGRSCGSTGWATASQMSPSRSASAEPSTTSPVEFRGRRCGCARGHGVAVQARAPALADSPDGRPAVYALRVLAGRP